MATGEDRPTISLIAADLARIAVRYELLHELGRGGMGIVYKARDRQTGDLVALKILQPSVAANPDLVERFKNELLLARRITHKNVCRVHDLSDFDGTAVISMEFVDGSSLRDLLASAESLSIRRGLQIARQIIAGLAEAHAQGVVHRDLKPENILIARDGSVRIMDFGIARLADSHRTVTGTIVGTPAYMSPEQVAGGAVDARSDIYSLGLVMYEMFCGRPAFTAETPVAIVAKQLHETPPAPTGIEPDLPRRIEHAILTCLHKKPAQRFQTVGELEAALSAGPAAVATSADEQPLPDRLQRWQNSDWALVAAAVVGLALFIPSFARTSLAPRTRITFDRTVLQRIAEEHLQRLGAPPAPVRQITAGLDPSAYVYVARQYGAAAARDLANAPIPYWTWRLEFDDMSMNVDNTGRLIAFSRTPVPLGAVSLDDARQQAVRTIESFYGLPAASLDLEQEGKSSAYFFLWNGRRNALGIRERYTVQVDGRGVSQLVSYPDLPASYSNVFLSEATMDRWGLPVAVVAFLFASLLAMFRRQRLRDTGPWRLGIAVVSFVGGAGFSLASFQFGDTGSAVSIAIALGLGLLYALTVVFGSIALEVMARKQDLYRLSTLASIFSRRGRSEPPGLSVLRGSAIGLWLLGLDAFVIWLGTTAFHARLSPINVGLLGGIINVVAWPAGVVIAIVCVQLFGIALLVGFMYSAVTRLPVPQWIAVTIAAAVLAAGGIRVSMGAVLPWNWTMTVLFVDYLVLVATFRRYDLLTVCAAVGTFALWWANYALFVMQQPIGATAPWTVFVVWGIVVAAAAGVAFQSALGRQYRRLLAAFD